MRLIREIYQKFIIISDIMTFQLRHLLAYYYNVPEINIKSIINITRRTNLISDIIEMSVGQLPEIAMVLQ